MAPAEPRGAHRRELWVAGLVAFLACLPFLDKAVHQDDWAYLTVGRLLVEHGRDVLDQATTYQGRPISAGQGVLHGPVWLSALALAQAPLFGERWLTVAHLMSAGMLALLAVSLTSLAARLGARPLPTALACALGPAPLVLATGVMTDLPMVALFCASLALAVRGLERGETPTLLLAGVVGALAAGTRYHGAAIVPLLAVLPLLWGPFRWRGLLPATVALAGFLAMLVGILAFTGGWDVLRATDELGSLKIDRTQCLLALVCGLGGALGGYLVVVLGAAPRWVGTLRGQPLRVLLLAGGLAFGGWCAWRAPQVSRIVPPGPNHALQWVLFLLGGAASGLGLAPLVRVRLVSAYRVWRAEHGRLAWIALWTGGFAVAAWLTVPFGSTRYAVPAMPGALLLCGVVATRLAGPGLHAAAALCCAALGLAAATADVRAAAVYPRMADVVAERADDDWSTGTTWIWGELGFRWYLERTAGLEVLPGDSTAPRPGDRVLKSMRLSTASPDDGSSGSYRLHPDVVRRLRPGAQLDFADPFPVRVHSSWAGAGFYGADGGFLPFSFASPLRDTLQVWDVEGEHPFFGRFDAAFLESADVPGARIGVDRFLAHPDQEMHLAVAIQFPGRITFPDVEVPPGGVLALEVAEHSRVWTFAEPGPGVIARVRVDGEVLAERRLDARRVEADRGWQPLRVDLSAHGGRRVPIAFEAQAQPLAEPLPDGAPDIAERFVVCGFAGLTFEVAP